MKIKFLADVNLSAAVVDAVLRLEASIDFQTHRIAGLDRKADPEVLRIAAQSGRLLVTHDRNTMPAHFRRFILKQNSPGIIVIPQRMRVKFVAGRPAPDVGGFGRGRMAKYRGLFTALINRRRDFRATLRHERITLPKSPAKSTASSKSAY